MRLIRTTARILCLKQKLTSYSLKNIGIQLRPHHIDSAIEFWIRLCQNDIRPDLENAVNRKGPPLKTLHVIKANNGTFLARGRTQKWNEISYNKDELPILHKTLRFSILFAEYMHRQGHLGVAAVFAKIRSYFWITGVELLVKHIRHHYMWCKKMYNQLESQVMAPLPIERLKPAPPWFYTGIYIFGPYTIRGEVNKRAIGKGYGIIFTCFLTRSVHLDLTCDYSTDAFLMTFRRFVSIRGHPKKAFSDIGSQLVAASKELKDMFSALNWNKIEEYSTVNNFEWSFSSGDAPWYNGCTEALIRSVKKSLVVSVGNQRLSYNELQTFLFESVKGRLGKS